MTQDREALLQQVAAVERAAAGFRGQRDRIAELVRNKRRPEHELKQYDRWVPLLSKAADTFRELVEQQGAKPRTEGEVVEQKGGGKVPCEHPAPTLF